MWKVCSFVVGLVIPRVSGISMDVAVPEDTGQDPALEVEQCSCPPGYRGPSCQVSPGPHPPVYQQPPWCFQAPPPLALPSSPGPTQPHHPVGTALNGPGPGGPDYSPIFLLPGL